MSASQLHLDRPRLTESDRRAEPPDMEWQTPALSEKFQSRLRHQASEVDSGDTGLGTTPSDSTEDFRSSSSSPSFQPIRSQIPIPTAHVMPSTAGPLAPKCQASATAPSGSRESSSSSSSKSCSLAKSASSPNLEGQTHADGGPATKPDCLSRYRSLVNGLDHSLFPPGGERSRLDDGQGFEVPTMEPTLNQSVLLTTFCPDPRYRLQMSGLGGTPEVRVGTGAESTYKLLPEAKPGLHGAPQRPSQQAMLRTSQGCEAQSQDRVCDEAAWRQQQHQLESLRLQVEHMKLLAAGTGQVSPVCPPSLLTSGTTWDAIIKASESLLKEKDLLIERQNQQMLQLKQRLRESELQVHSALLGHNAPYPDVCLLRLQEAQRENAFLRAQFAERNESVAKDAAQAERRLAVAEAESGRLSDELREVARKHAEEKKKQEERIRSRDKHISSLKKKCHKESELSRERQQRIETLERYLGDLPTQEDHRAQSKELEEAHQRVQQLQEAVGGLETHLAEARAVLRVQESQLEEQKQREKELLATVTSLQERVQQGLEDGARLPSLDAETLREENAVLREELQRLRKVTDEDQRLLDQLGTQIRALEKQQAQEEGASQALREELLAKDRSLQQLRSAVKELSDQNQELVERTLTLQEKLAECDRDRSPASQEEARLSRRLHAEMAACLGDLRSLCSVLTQRAQGRDPNLSLLLGVTPSAASADQSQECSSPEVLGRKLVEVQQLRRDVEDLRTLVSDRYAQDMGDSCITQ
ncbi:centrosomal protein of 85 kDa isoform X2 [Scleropages formosus]|uniref:centrosomal protein of 85 kDa isoform X2 n=1 Tax=Scleropages formosus TaxID=113540 RepID=UPI00087819C8|nr:centrosomal protein of 85 kDa isoform X2 [Scleropages formosus]XP_018590136.1 centrosomal protein of 85 kDa isoform X2 [Scleropages formosus]